MPTYEYRCKDCGHELEAVQSFTDDALAECPACGGKLKKVFGTVGISFKGSGFYKNDSRSSATKKSQTTAAASTKSESTSSPSGSSSDSSPASASGSSRSSGSSDGSSTGSNGSKGSKAPTPA